MANTDKNRNRITAEEKMKLTRISIPVLTFAATTLLVAQQGKPEPFPAPGDPLPAPAPTTLPRPAPAPVTPSKPAPSPVVPNPIPAPIAVPAPIPAPIPAPVVNPEATLLTPQQPVSDPSIGLGTVRGTKVSARGKATIFSALVFQFNKNESVNILEEINIANPKAGEPRRWYRVQVPRDAGLWVHSDYLNPATTAPGVNGQGKPVKLNVAVVKANLLNVRGGAGEEFPILSKLPAGAQIVLTGASKAKWREVLAPQNASVYVAAQFVTRQKITSGVVEVPQIPVPNPTVTPPAPNPSAAPLPPTPPPPPPASVVPLEIKKFGQNNPKTPGGVQVKRNSSTQNPQPTTNPVKPTAPSKPKETIKPIQLAKTNPALPAPTTTKPKNETPVRIVHREGIIRRTLDIQSPSGYVLEHLESGKKINYLVLDKKVALKLNWFIGKKVLVTGEEALDARNAVTPVLLVSTLKGELTKEFIAKMAAVRSEAAKKAEKAKEEELKKQPPAKDQPKASDQKK
ncbi:MAG: hypothetical protein VX945_03750, partial [Verrucomicrobiota bacterium]|nr:hypothetical protein [Verrucomicrobiota bacterium]